MSRLADELGLQVETSPEGEQRNSTRADLEQYGIKGKTVDVTPVAEQSVIVLKPDTVIQTALFGSQTSPSNSNKSVEFPNKTKAFNFSHISVDLDINLGADEQTSLKQLQYFLKNSTIKTKLNRRDHLSIPLAECVPFVIEYDGTALTKRIVRTGFAIREGIKVPLNGEFEVQLVPAPDYKTDATVVNPSPEQPNVIRLTLHGHSLQVA